ncbi:hypothetical protein BTS2_2133 [Bacillus sp. TS-2]|nr:hypothetical protein BTS2_2133 [Bacillus sp. TS-2]
MRFATWLEKSVVGIMKERGIHTISDLSMENLCDKFHIDVIYQPQTSHCIHEDDYDYALICIDNRLPFYEQRMKFFHELSHVLFHPGGDQRFLNQELTHLQEIQAERIALYTSMPRHIFEPIIHKQHSIESLTELFEIPSSFISERILIIQNERLRESYQQALQELDEKHLNKSLQPNQIHPSTQSILRKLARLVGEENIEYSIKQLL